MELEGSMVALNSDVPDAEVFVQFRETEALIIQNHCFNALAAYDSKKGVFEKFLVSTKNTELKARGQELLFRKFVLELALNKIDEAFSSLVLLREVSFQDDFFFHLGNINIGNFLYTHYRYAFSPEKR
ncbi:MAG: hypothetical protein AAFV07_16710, partial [Bacteroidota bacterium]